ncbi:heavy metal translocating P-type ATPase [Desulfosarcina sp. OttesenSCG-928-A07]|nr:heavy metal translocating P-type ATPase [Desulfosarcina sp. OttesenSCG-928-G17]MDL2330082.1 heavy metal translocating P-type ATPase [Desulfosarcina sp. OttesenSCG-928-A07]
MTLSLPKAGMRVGRFRVVHVLPGRVRLKSPFLGAPHFDGVYFQALLEALPGIRDVRINTRGLTLVIAFDGRPDTWERAAAYLRDIPNASCLYAQTDDATVRTSDVVTKAALTLAAQMVPYPARAVISWAVCLDTLLEGTGTLISRGVRVEVLDAMAVGLSLVQRNYFAANMISTLLSLGTCLEGRSERRSAALLKSLLRPQAESVWVVRNGTETRIPVADVKIGDHVICGPGEAVVIDGTVIDGEASVNQSSISGESVPVHVKPGDPVISGSVVDEGRLVIDVEHTGAETAVARIGRFIDQSIRQHSEKQTQNAALADSLVPVTLGLGALVFAVTRDIRRMASILTVDYSCAIRLTLPIAVRSGIYAAGQAGVLLKGAAAVDALQDVDTLVFDKTGTLTTGHLAITDIIPLNGMSGDELLALAAGAEAHYDHPVARSVVREAQNRNLSLPATSRVDFIVAHGVSAFIGGKNIRVGSHHFIAEDEGIFCGAMDARAHDLRASGKTLLYVACENQLAGILALRDQPRPEAAGVLETLKKTGIRRIVMLTGDHRDTALALQHQLPWIDEVRFELKPEDKAAVMAELKANGSALAFVGDGVNDAPALVNADVGICMPGGADLAKEAAQVLLLKEDLTLLVHGRAAAKRTRAIIRQCFGATLSSNTATIVMAMMGLPPTAAALIHNLSTIGIITYAGLAASRPLISTGPGEDSHADYSG